MTAFSGHDVVGGKGRARGAGCDHHHSGGPSGSGGNVASGGDHVRITPKHKIRRTTRHIEHLDDSSA